MSKPEYLGLGVDFNDINSYEDYRHIWDKLAPVQIKMIEKNEKCKHNLGDTFVYNTHYDKPADLCYALSHVLELYIFRASIGFPSWEEDPNIYRIHCPDKKGTVWEVRRSSSAD